MLTDAEIMTQVLAAFQEEQAEHRQNAGELLLQLERAPDHPQRQALLDQLFREAHSLKGGARAAGLEAVEQIAHRIEDLFSAARQGQSQLAPDTCDLIYAALDAIGALMGRVAAGMPADLAPYADLLDRLARSAAGAAPPASRKTRGSQRGETRAAARKIANGAANGHTNGAAANGHANGHTNGAAANGHANGASGETSAEAHRAPASDPHDAAADDPAQPEASTIRIATATLDTLMNEAGELLTCSLRSREHARATFELAESAARWRRIWRHTRVVAGRMQERIAPIRPTVHYLDHHDDRPQASESRDLDADTGLLLRALNEANALIDDLERRLGLHGRQIAEDSIQLAAVVDRLQGQVRQARMLPLRTIFGPIKIQAREMARAAGKQVALDFGDGEVAADRAILERLRDVTLHLLRNAIDHGIEPPNAREALGKPPEGRIELRAEVSSDRLALTMTDDGAGLDLAAVRQRALAGGLVGENELARMGEAEVSQLIFLPGLSTRQTVSVLSGRGVGLDIVRAHVERLRGRVEVSSASGQGCAFRLSVPLSLASAHGLVLQVGQAVYALPLDTIERIVAVAPRDIKMLEGRAVIMLDDRPLPIVHLGDVLGGAAPAAGGVARLALVIGSGERRVAYLIDAVLGEQDLVTHRLPAPLRSARFIASAAILPDGSVAPILDVVDLLDAAIGASTSLRAAEAPQASSRARIILVVDDSITTRTLEKNILEAEGYRVRLATDGAEALQLLAQMADDGGCDLLLSDVDMPHLNGFDLTAQVRATPHFQGLPIVLVTSLDTPADRERGIAAGADAYIVKRNFDQRKLIETIAELL